MEKVDYISICQYNDYQSPLVPLNFRIINTRTNLDTMMNGYGNISIVHNNPYVLKKYKGIGFCYEPRRFNEN